MSIYINGKLVAGGSQTLPLLSFMWSDHQLNHPSWLRADTFSWQSGAVYTAVYQHLVDDIDGKIAQSETIGDTTIQFYLADDGHKICPASEESNVSAIYNSTGVAWYYILDVANKQFKLPRTKWGFTGIRDGVGNYVPAGLPNITGDIIPTSAYSGVVATGAFYGTERSASTITNGGSGSNAGNRTIVGMSASRSSSIYGNSTTVQPKATEMYLYFYVGNFTQTALENTAGLNAEMFNDLNAHKVIEFQIPTVSNGYTWYRLYADGWVEQGGIGDNGSETTVYNYNVVLPVEMANSDYNISVTPLLSSRDANGGTMGFAYTATTTGFIAMVASKYQNAGRSRKVFWQVSGMSA